MSEIFSGLEGAGTQSSRPPPSTLEEFVDRSPGKGPPPLEALERAIPSFEEDEDDEARIARLEGFPELAGPLPSSEPVTTTPNPSPTHEEPMSTQDEGVGIAPELATAHEAPSSDHIEGGVSCIRVIVDLEDAVMTEGGPVPMNRGMCTRSQWSQLPISWILGSLNSQMFEANSVESAHGHLDRHGVGNRDLAMFRNDSSFPLVMWTSIRRL